MALRCDKRPCPSPVEEDDFDADLRDYGRAHDLSKCRKTKQMSDEAGVGARDKPLVVNNVDLISWDMFMRRARGQQIVQPNNFGGIQEELYSTLANLQKQTTTSGILKKKPLMRIRELFGSQKVGFSALVVFFDVWDSMTDPEDDEEKKVRNIFVNIDIKPKGLTSINYEQVHSTNLDSSDIAGYLRRFRQKENKAKMLRP